MIRFFLTVFSALLNIIPTRIASVLGGALGGFWYRVIRFRRDVVRDNLRLAYRETKTEAEIEKLAIGNFRHYGQLLFEFGRSVNWQTEDYRRHVPLHGIENLTPFLKRGQGGLLLAAHLGNWELAVASAAAHGVPIDIVVKHARNPNAEAMLQWYRSKMGVGVFLESGTAKDILRSISKGRFVVFILDQFMGPPIGLPVKFFGQEAGTVVSLALFTEKKGVPVVPVYSYRDESGTIHGVIEPPLELPEFSEDKNERLYQKTQFFNDIIETMVRRHPEQWLWLHRRWKAYRGVPRWLTKQALALVLMSWLAAGCTSIGDTPTGIPLPPDPTINAPKFKTPAPITDSGDFVPDEVTVVEDATPTPGPSAAATPTATATTTPEPKKKPAKHKEPPRPVERKAPLSSYFSVVPSDKVPFEVGEKIDLDLTWMAIPAGRITLEVRDGQTFDNRPTFHLWGHLLSSKVADAIYHVDNTIEAYIDKEGFIPYKFLLHMVETAQKKETRVSFDHNQNKAYYWAQRLSKKWGDEKQDRVDSYRPRSRDMFSAVYFARTLNFQLNKKQIFPVYENNQNIDVEMLPVANELVTTKAGVFQCWKILCTVKINNVLRPTGDVYLWLSDDSKKYVVKFDAKLKIGSLLGIMNSVREH